MNNYARQEMGNCNFHTPSNYMKTEPVGMAYVPWQYFHHVHEPDKALMCGTIFPELYKPFFGKRGACQL